jgi:SAM-dependent methyltransferase
MMQLLPETLHLGSVHKQPIIVDQQILQESFIHAQSIAQELGLSEAESSVAAYWSLSDRVVQWQRIFSRIDLSQAQQSSFVEVGSGLGLFVLLGKCLGIPIVGIESSSDRYQRSLRIAQALTERNRQSATFINAVAEAIPLASQSIDVVASFHTFEHVADLNQSFQEIHRILRPGGLLYTQIPNYQSFYEAHYGIFTPLGLGKASTYRILQFLGRPTGFLDHLQWLQPKLLEQALHQAGFRHVQISSIPRTKPELAQIELADLPFRFRRGGYARRGARALALLAERGLGSKLYYPNLEVWAEA